MMKKMLTLAMILVVLAIGYCTVNRTLDFLPVQRAEAEGPAKKVCTGGHQPVVDAMLTEETAKFPTYCQEIAL